MIKTEQITIITFIGQCPDEENYIFITIDHSKVEKVIISVTAAQPTHNT